MKNIDEWNRIRCCAKYQTDAFSEVYIHKKHSDEKFNMSSTAKKKASLPTANMFPKTPPPKKQVKNRVSHLFPQNSQGKNLKNIKSIAALR